MHEEMNADEALCLRCGETYLRAAVHLRTVMELGKLPAQERGAKLVELERVEPNVADAWLRHNMDASCEKRVAFCPSCGGKLTTWQAKWCPHCKHDWH